MTDQNPFLLGEPLSPDPQINGLLAMLRYARRTTLATVQPLTVAQLDHLQGVNANSIGALLLHMAAVEAWYQANTFDEREWNTSEKARWQAAFDLGPFAQQSIRNRPLSFYQDTFAEVRARTEGELISRDEGWLSVAAPFCGITVNRYWKWFHVCEDEINHRGQIRWLVKRSPAP